MFVTVNVSTSIIIQHGNKEDRNKIRIIRIQIKTQWLSDVECMKNCYYFLLQLSNLAFRLLSE